MLDGYGGSARIGHHSGNGQRVDDRRVAVFCCGKLQQLKKSGVKRVDGVRAAHTNSYIDACSALLQVTGEIAGISQSLLRSNQRKLGCTVQTGHGSRLPSFKVAADLCSQRVG